MKRFPIAHPLIANTFRVRGEGVFEFGGEGVNTPAALKAAMQIGVCEMGE